MLVIADLGSAGNLVKNLLLLSEQTDWPLADDRYNRILSQYRYSRNIFRNWLQIEGTLRFWQTKYRIDLSNNLDWATYADNCATTTWPIVFLNHSAFYQLDQLSNFVNKLKTIYVSPVTEFGLDWQIKSYCKKKGIDNLHDFTFDIDKENQINQYIELHGQNQYNELNISNMKEIVGSRQKEMQKLIPKFIPLEEIISGDIHNLHNLITEISQVDINFAQFSTVLTRWRKLHYRLRRSA